jgi:DNA-binding XRE family transcriptional regulator
LRRRRLELGLLQREVAERLGADHSTITNWEPNRTKPALRFLPRIINLLGFDPSAPGASLGERVKAWRHRAGSRRTYSLGSSASTRPRSAAGSETSEFKRTTMPGEPRRFSSNPPLTVRP